MAVDTWTSCSAHGQPIVQNPRDFWVLRTFDGKVHSRISHPYCKTELSNMKQVPLLGLYLPSELMRPAALAAMKVQT